MFEKVAFRHFFDILSKRAAILRPFCRFDPAKHGMNFKKGGEISYSRRTGVKGPVRRRACPPGGAG